MAFIIKVLGAGVHTTSGTVDGYVVPANRSALVTSVRVVNGLTGSPIPTGTVLVKPSGGSSRNLVKKGAVLSSAMLLLEESITLGQGDAIQIALDPPSGPFSVEYSIFGVERD